MPSSWKPAGHSTVSPYLIAAGAQRVMDFLTDSRRSAKVTPDRRGGVKDPAGNTWWFATQR